MSSKFVAVALLASAITSDAFVPLTSLTHAQHISSGAPKSSFVPTAGPQVQTRPSGTSLHMGGNLIDRFFRVANANVNKLISSLENPEKVIVQAVSDMQVCESEGAFAISRRSLTYHFGLFKFPPRSS